jgi:hypothetical protein
MEGEDLAEPVRDSGERKAGDLIVQVIFTDGIYADGLIGKAGSGPGRLEQMADVADGWVDIIC